MAAVPFTPQERDAWKAEQKRKATWHGLYGWRPMPVIIESAVLNPDTEKPETVTLPFPQYSRKVFSHPPGALVIGSRKRTNVPQRVSRPEASRKRREQEAAGRFYIVFKDQSLRAITKGVFEALSTVPPTDRLDVLAGKKPLYPTDTVKEQAA